MKAKYVKPTVKVLDLETEQLLAALSSTDTPAQDYIDNLSKEHNNIVGQKYDIWGLDEDVDN